MGSLYGMSNADVCPIVYWAWYTCMPSSYQMCRQPPRRDLAPAIKILAAFYDWKLSNAEWAGLGVESSERWNEVTGAELSGLADAADFLRDPTQLFMPQCFGQCNKERTT